MTESVLLRIDDPEDRILRKPMTRIRGWFAVAHASAIGQIELRIGDARVPWQEQARPDVSEEYPNRWVTGFDFDLDLSHYLYAIRSSELTLTAIFPRAPEMQMQFSVEAGVTARCLAAAAGV